MADASASSQTTAPYMVNLDPAVGTLGYEPNVDIRDTVDYARVMEQYNLGPNGGILTALNLFTTKFDQVLNILEKRAKEVDHIVWILLVKSRSSLGLHPALSSPMLSPAPCQP